LTIENYVKTIFQICTRQGGKPATTGEIATVLQVSPGTVTSMLKTLSESELATYAPYEGVRLTSAGKALALRIIRRHRLIEVFLVRTLGLSWHEVHEEAEHLEHAVSDRLIERIDAFLDHPKTDPHGDPIPTAEGNIEDHHTHSLAELGAGAPFRIVRVLDQSPDFLRYLSEAGLVLGAGGQVTANRPEAGVIAVQLASGDATIGHGAAEKLLVEVGQGSGGGITYP
jgi:DtxR family Mn-dependent transcriptional regulator